MTTFHLPDLGEGLAEAEIVAWHIKEGDQVHVDQPMMSVETAKAVVDVPSPFPGKVLKLYATAGDVVATGKPLVDFELAPGATYVAPPTHSAAQAAATVVGFMPVSDTEWVERSGTSPAPDRTRQRQRAAPSVRMLAKRLEVNLSNVHGSG
ncbi:MAG TPA: biotin/lipoyl-containing protein, partial [Steroidobacteraceae bacterium]|nr:biotin/lipoyl-containing protein [Steroidobacteraceae bacterium]